VLIHCCQDVFTAQLRSYARGANHRKRRSSIVARFHFRGNVFTGPLPINELFRLSGVMSHCIIFVDGHTARSAKVDKI
jgi:hypothetical protein